MILLNILLWLFRVFSTLWISLSCIGGLITHPLRSGGTDDWESWMGCTVERVFFDIILVSLASFVSFIKNLVLKKPVSSMVILKEFKGPVGIGLFCQVLILLFTFGVYMIDEIENCLDQRNNSLKEINSSEE